MRIRFFIISTFISILSTLNIFAQNDSTTVLNAGANYLKNNWYVEIGGGIQCLNSEDASKLSSSDRYSSSFSISTGKWVSPAFGIRMQIQAYTMNGLSSTKGIYLADPVNNSFLYGNNDPVRAYANINPDGSYIHVINYMNPHVDAQFNLFNLLGENNKNYSFNLIPSIGIGYMHVFEYNGVPSADLMTTNLSLMAKYHVDEHWDINMEVNKAILLDPFDGRIVGRMQESNTAFNLGVTYNFDSKKPIAENKAESLFQQKEEKTTKEYKNPWFFESGIGSQILFSENTNDMNFSERMSPSFGLSVGKWFSPVFGGRVQIQGAKLNDLSNGTGYFTENKIEGNSMYGYNDPVLSEAIVDERGFYRRDVNYMNLHLDIQISLQNLLNNAVENYKFDVIPAVGIGYMRVFENKGIATADLMTRNFSLMGKYKLNKSWDINLELQTAFFSDKYDGRITGKMDEKNMSLAIGCTYNLFKNKKKNETIIIQESIVTKPTPPETGIKHDTIFLKDIIEKTVEQTLAETDSKPFILASVLFSRNSIFPEQGQDVLLLNVVNFLMDNPNKKIRLDAYGDAATGTEKVNFNISNSRADYLEDLLIKKYGVNPELIEKNIVGSKEQPYKKDALNRVVVIVALSK